MSIESEKIILQMKKYSPMYSLRRGEEMYPPEVQERSIRRADQFTQDFHHQKLHQLTEWHERGLRELLGPSMNQLIISQLVNEILIYPFSVRDSSGEVSPELRFSIRLPEIRLADRQHHLPHDTLHATLLFHAKEGKFDDSAVDARLDLAWNLETNSPHQLTLLGRIGEIRIDNIRFFFLFPDQLFETTTPDATIPYLYHKLSSTEDGYQLSYFNENGKMIRQAEFVDCGHIAFNGQRYQIYGHNAENDILDGE